MKTSSQNFRREQLESMDEAEVRSSLVDLGPQDLEILIERCNHEYWDENQPSLSDPLYDQLVEQLKRLNPDSAILAAMGPQAPGQPAYEVQEALQLAPEQRFGIAVRHQRPMLSLDKCYHEADLLVWAGKFTGEIVLMPKMDGVACSLRYNQQGKLELAATRGSGYEGDDITANVMRIADVPKTLINHGGRRDIEVRGEIYMRLSQFAQYKGEYSNPRNLAAGSIKQKEWVKSRADQLNFFPYDVLGKDFGDEREKFAFLQQIGFSAPEFHFVERDQLQAGYEAFARKRASLDYEIDGVVYRASLISEQVRLGETGHHPRYAIAYKFQGDTGVTDLEDVLWSVSRTGTITPVALLEPVELSGAMIARASLHNLSCFFELGLTRGCRVEVTRRGGVIPNVERVVETGPGKRAFAIPTQCPACGGPVEQRKKREGEFLQCAEPGNCIQARLGELEHFAKVVDLQGFGPKVIAQAVDAQLLSTPADFYRLRAIDLQALERLGEKSAQNLIEQVDQHKQLSLATFLQALGIDHLGKQNAQLLARTFTSLKRIRQLTRDDLMAIRGIKEAIADAIVAGIHNRSEMIDALLEYVDVQTEDPTSPPEVGQLSGKSFVFTGTLESITREEAQRKVQALGAETPTGVNKHLSFLVVGSGRGAKSSKQKKAEQLIQAGANIQILSETEFLAMVE